MNTKSHKTHFHLENRQEVDNFKITFVDTGLDTLPGERILRCSKYIPSSDKYFMVTYGDGVANINVKKIVAFHKKQKAEATISGVHPRSKFGMVKVNKENLVTGFQEKPVLSDWVNGGFMIFNTNTLDLFKKRKSELTVLKKLSREKKLGMYKHSGFWFAVDTYKEYVDLNEIWNGENPPWKVWK